MHRVHTDTEWSQGGMGQTAPRPRQPVKWDVRLMFADAFMVNLLLCDWPRGARLKIARGAAFFSVRRA